MLKILLLLSSLVPFFSAHATKVPAPICALRLFVHAVEIQPRFVRFGPGGEIATVNNGNIYRWQNDWASPVSSPRMVAALPLLSTIVPDEGFEVRKIAYPVFPVPQRTDSRPIRFLTKQRLALTEGESILKLVEDDGADTKVLAKTNFSWLYGESSIMGVLYLNDREEFFVALALHPDAGLRARSQMKVVRLHIESGQFIVDKNFLTEDTYGVIRGMEVSPDGKRIIILTSHRGGTRVFDRDGSPRFSITTRSLAPEGTHPTPFDEPRQVAFSPDSERFIVRYGDGYLREFRSQDGEETHAEVPKYPPGSQLPRAHDYSSVIYSPSGEWVAAVTPDRQLKIWEAGSWRLVKTFMQFPYDVGAVYTGDDFMFKTALYFTGDSSRLGVIFGHDLIVLDMGKLLK